MTTLDTAPLLSIVVVGRNDDFGGDFNARMMAAAEFNHRNLIESGISHEYVLVEWNPIPGKPYLADVLIERLPWWDRRYVVAPAWHVRFSTNPRLVFMEFCAKNVGIRRARGRFVLTTNTDIWLSREVLRALPRLRGGIVYRAIRIDLKREVGYEAMSFDVLDHPESALRVNFLGRDYYANGAGDFLLLDRDTYMDLRGFNEIFRDSKIHKDANFCVHARKRSLPFEVLGNVYHLDHESSWNNVKHLYGPNHRQAPFGRSDWAWEEDYQNPPTWGLGGAPEEIRDGGLIYIGYRPPVETGRSCNLCPGEPGEESALPVRAPEPLSTEVGPLVERAGDVVCEMAETANELAGPPDLVAVILDEGDEHSANLQALQDRLRLTTIELEETRQCLQTALEALRLSRERIAAMENTKFWRLRRLWFRLKRAVGFGGNE